jgi:hypothetical protein
MAKQQIIDSKLLNQFGKDYVNVLVFLLKNNTVPSRAGLPAYPKVASGRLINSIDYRLRETAQGIQFQLLAEDYLQYVDKGRKPGTYPPISAIRKWARIKGLPKGAEYGIQKNIFKFGIKPTNVIRRAQLRIETFRQYQIKYEQGVVDAIVKSIKKDVETGNKGFVSISVS